MNDEKKKELQKSIDNFEKQLEELKRENPNEDFAQLQNLINHLKMMLDETNKKGYAIKSFFKTSLFFLLLFLIYVICIGATMGFFFRYLNLANPSSLIYLIPIVAAILFVSHRFIGIVNNSFHSNHILISFICSYFVVILLLSLIDSVWIHIGNNFFATMFALIGATLLSVIGEYYLTKKMLFW